MKTLVPGRLEEARRRETDWRQALQPIALPIQPPDLNAELAKYLAALSSVPGDMGEDAQQALGDAAMAEADPARSVA